MDPQDIEKANDSEAENKNKSTLAFRAPEHDTLYSAKAARKARERAPCVWTPMAFNLPSNCHVLEEAFAKLA